MTYRLTAALAAALAASSCLLVGCSASTEVSLTGNTPAQYSHVWITTAPAWGERLKRVEQKLARRLKV